MRIPTIIFLFILIFKNISAFRPDSTRTELLELLKERKQLFEKYNASLSRKSGFFGNKTKNDLRDSQEKLIAVVTTDNKIMNSLSRTLDFRNFEKQKMSYDVNSFEERLRNLSVLNDTLNSQFIKCKQENKILKSTIKRLHLYIGFLIVLILLTGIAWFRKKNFK